MTHVDFLIENNTFWHLKPKLREGINYHTSMEPLRQLLGDGVEISYISKCNPREQLILCYILANSLLYLYPGSWFQTEWTSNMVYFIRSSSTSTSPALTYPYISVELQSRVTSKHQPDHMQIHTHPAILALGIIFLEIVTGTRFERTREETSWEQCNKDLSQAWRRFGDLKKKERHSRSRHISSSLSQAISACLQLDPPPSFPSNRLSEEGPIRHYILSCIVRPLAHELQEGYKVSLDDLNKSLVPEKERGESDDIGELKRLSRQSTASVEKVAQANKISMNSISATCVCKHTKTLSEYIKYCRQYEAPVRSKCRNIIRRAS